jgi:hypothetical protein
MENIDHVFYRLSRRFIFAIAAWELAVIRPSRNYSEGSFFWRERRRWRYACPSSLYDAAAPLSKNLAQLT